MKDPTEALIRRLIGRVGDEPIPRNVRWGSRQGISSPLTGLPTTRATYVSSPVFDDNTPMAFQVAFADPLGNQPNVFKPVVPTSLEAPYDAVVVVRLMKSIDTRSPAVIDEIILLPGDTMPIVEVICRQLTVTVSLEQAGTALATLAVPLNIEVSACPVHSVDRESLNGRVGYPTTFHETLAAGASGGRVFPSRPNRTQFFAANYHATDTLLIGLGEIPIATLGAITRATLAIPPGGRYESPVGGFAGDVYAIWLNETAGTTHADFYEGFLPLG